MWRLTDPEVAALLNAAVEEGVFPGCVAAYGGTDSLFVGAFGFTDCTQCTPVSMDTVYDVASLTKVLYTTLRAMEGVRDGAFELDTPIASVLPGYHEGVTVRHLLLHTSGLPAHRLYPDIASSPSHARELILREPLLAVPGERTEYSCIGFLVLHFFLEALGGVVPETWAQIGACFQFSPCPEAAPTEVLDGVALKGVVHDENARFLGGRAGNAGLFGDALNVARIAHFWLREGEGLYPESMIREWRKQQADRALGWDIKAPVGSSAGDRFGPASYGHTGFTGTSVWMDPEAGIFAVLLSNRVHPTRENLRIKDLRPRYHDAVARCLANR